MAARLQVITATTRTLRRLKLSLTHPPARIVSAKGTANAKPTSVLKALSVRCSSVLIGIARLASTVRSMKARASAPVRMKVAGQARRGGGYGTVPAVARTWLNALIGDLREAGKPATLACIGLSTIVQRGTESSRRWPA